MDILVAGRGRPYSDGDALDHTAPMVFTVPAILSSDECQALVARIDALGPVAAPVSTAAGFEMRPDVRNNTRVMFDDRGFAAQLFERLRSSLPPVLCGMTACGVNERFRCYRYEPGQRFAPHYDGAFVRSAKERSQLTFMVYLNDAFTGGTTRFEDVEVAPRTGMALLFQHYLLHEGCTVTTGAKYVLRSDVMFSA